MKELAMAVAVGELGGVGEQNEGGEEDPEQIEFVIATALLDGLDGDAPEVRGGSDSAS